MTEAEELENEFWAQLVSVTEVESSPILITKNRFVIGRGNDCDLSFSGNKLVSGKHCYIEREADKVWVYDTSTNGTLLNTKTKLSKGERRELNHGDEIHIVHKKNAMEENIGYLYQERNQLDQEEMTQDYSYDADMTLPDDDVNQVTESSDDDPKVKASLKRKKQDGEIVTDVPREKKEKTEPEDTAEQLNKPKAQDVSDESDDAQKPSTSKDGASGVSGNDDGGGDNDLLDTLTCIICQEILHDCISLQPCMHSFCAGCYSEWMEQSNECPSCRSKVDRINKNHLVNNLVEAFIKSRPDKKRQKEDLDELDEKNKITRDMLYPVKQRDSDDGNCSGSGSVSEDEYNNENDDEENEVEDQQATGQYHGFIAGIGTPFFGTAALRPAAVVCRQCVGYNTPLNPPNLFNAQDTPEDPDDEDAKTSPDAPHFTCGRIQNHVLCLCCLQPMPDRRMEYTDGGTIPPQQCGICYRSFCHAYWGCRQANCHGCLGKLKDLNFGKNILTHVIMNNAYESNVLKDYLASQGMSVKALWADCLAKMVTGKYKCINQNRLNNGMNTPLCFTCGINMFRDLAYAYRKDIPNDQLPNEVTKRPNCYWGKNCHTQRNKPEHARKFNHICDQTRTA